MKRCSPLLARAQRVPQRLPRATTTLGGWCHSVLSYSRNSHLQSVPRSPVRRPHPIALVTANTSRRCFASGTSASNGTTNKTPVPADDFESLKQFLMAPTTQGERAAAARAIVVTMMDRHVYADMSGQEAAVMSMVADALEDYEFVIDVYKCLRAARVAPSPMTLELTAAACASTGDWPTVHDVIDQMHAAVDIMHPSIDIYENAVLACHAANKWMQGKQLLEAIKNDGLDAAPETHVLVMETALQCREFTATTRLFHGFLEEFPMLERDELRDVLRGLVAMAVDHDVLDHALFFRDQLAQRRLPIPPATYEQLIALSARQGNWHSARVLLAQCTNAKKLPVAAPSHDFTSDTVQLLDDLHAHGMGISLAVYNAALRAFGATTQFAKAETLLKTMQQRGVTPDTVSYAAVICSCGSDVDASQRYWNEMKQAKVGFSMDVLHVYLLAASRARQWQKVIDRYKTIRKVTSEEERKQVRQDARIMACLATAYGQLERDDDMLRVFTDMKVHGLVPNLYVYAEAMRAYVRKGQWRHALMLFDHLWTEGIDKEKLAQFRLTWDAAVDAAIVGDDTERLETLYQQITTQHGRVNPHSAAALIGVMTTLPTNKVWNDFRNVQYLHECGDGDFDNCQVVNAVLKRAVSEWDVALAEEIVEVAEQELGMRRFNAMTFSLMVELYARLKDQEEFMKWLTKMADADSKVTAYTIRALLDHLQMLEEDQDDEGIEALADGAARVFSMHEERRVDVAFTPFANAADLGRKMLDLWEVRGNPIHLPALEAYIGLCRSAEDLEDVFQRIDRQADSDEPLVIPPEFVHTLFLMIAEIAPELQPRLREFLITCLETQPVESARAALGVFCSFSSNQEITELLRALLTVESDDEEDGAVEMDDDELQIFLASCAGETGGPEDDQEGELMTVDVDQLYEICSLIEEHDVSLGGGSMTFLLRAALTLARTRAAEHSQRGQETEDLVKRLLAATLEGSSRHELRAFIEEIAADPRDHAHIDALLELV